MDIAQLVEQQQIETPIARDDPREPALVGRLDELVDQLGTGGIAHGPTLLARSKPHADEEMALAGPRVAEEDRPFALVEVGARRQGGDGCCVDRRGGHVEVVEALRPREAGFANAALASAFARSSISAEEHVGQVGQVADPGGARPISARRSASERTVGRRSSRPAAPMAAIAAVWVILRHPLPSRRSSYPSSEGVGRSKWATPGSSGGSRTATLGGLAGLDDHDVGVERTDSEGALDAGHHGVEGQHTVREQDVDEGLGALPIAQAASAASKKRSWAGLNRPVVRPGPARSTR